MSSPKMPKKTNEADIELAPGYTIKTDKPGIYKGTKTTSGYVGGQSGEAMAIANRVLDAIEEQDPSSSEEVFALARKFCKEMDCTDDAKKRVYKQLAKMGWAESIEEADIDENAFNQAAAAAARANKDSFEFNGKTYKTKMDKSTAHKLDDDVDMLRKLAGLA
jgi:DNA-binding transcriptional MocR family regulator